MNQPPPPTGPPTTPSTAPPTDLGGSAPPLLDVGRWLTDTTRTLVHGFGEFFAVLTIVSLGATALSSPLLWFGSRELVLTRDDNGSFGAVEGVTGSQGAMLLGGVVVLFLAQLLLFAAATAHVDDVRSGHRPSWRATLVEMIRRGPRVVSVAVQILMLSVLVIVVLGVLTLLVPALGIVAGLATAIVLIGLWIRSALALTHAGLGLQGSGVSASFRWSRGRTWQLLGRLVLLTTIVFGVLLLASFVAAPFQSLSGAASPTLDGDLVMSEVIGSSIPAFLGGQFINALASGLVSALWASAMLSIYRNEPVQD